MNLYVVKFSGSYAFGVRIVRAETKEEAAELVKKDFYGVFTSMNTMELPIEGGTEVLFTADYIE